MNTATSLLGLLFDHTIGNILRMLAVIRLPKLERGPVSHGFVATLIVIMGYGLVMLFSASYSSGYANYGDVYYFIRPQGVIAVLGLVAMLIISNINYRALRYMNESFYIITVVLLIAALLSPEDTNGTYRWVYFAGGSFSLQPSELAKFSVMLWTADMLDRDHAHKTSIWYGLLKPALPLVPILVLLKLEPHNSAILLLCAIFGTMILCNGSAMRWWPMVGAAGVAGVIAFLKHLASGDGYAAGRLGGVWGLTPTNTAGMQWQTLQSIYAICTGGLFGVGIGNSVQKHQWLPYAENDFIFAVIGEELGFVGAQDLEGIAQYHPAARIHAGKPLDCRFYLDNDRCRQLDFNADLLQIRELLRKLCSFFCGGEAEKIGVFLNAEGVDQLFFRVDAGVGRGCAVEIFDTEDRDLEQQIDGHECAHGQYGQYTQNPQRAAAVALADQLCLRYAPLLSGAAGAVAGLLRVDLLGRLRASGAWLAGLGGGRFPAGGLPLFQSHAAAEAAAVVLRAGAAHGSLPAAALVVPHMSGSFRLGFGIQSRAL